MSRSLLIATTACFVLATPAIAQFRSGAKVEVREDGTRLARQEGDFVLSKGTRLEVVRTRGSWVGVRELVRPDGERKRPYSGWIKASEIRVIDRQVTNPAGAARSRPTADGNSDWHEFRRRYPFHVQTLALSNARRGTRTLIISEPPPHFSAKYLETLPTRVTNVQEKQHRVGHDGFVMDIVANVTDDGSLPELLSQLSRDLFYTSYKGYAVSLTTRPDKTEAVELDLTVTSTEIDDWITADSESFLPVDGGRPLRLEDVLGLRQPKVFFSSTPGLVVWWLPRGFDLAESPETVRQFALDSDLIPGAMRESRGVLVVGRERIVPLDVLPPLRTETVLTLSAVKTAELGQSYERNHPLAGRFQGNRDWAPIFLSPELINTEFGSLLNIADQLLKGWSNAGQTHYIRFEYPRPSTWPFASPLPEHLNVDEVIYNWNTAGAGYTVAIGAREIFALNRTGALPVSFIPGGDRARLANQDAKHHAIVDAEERAYEYFANTSDPNLVRVQQYTALYQIFKRFGVRSSYRRATLTDPMTTILPELLRQEFRRIRDARLSDLKKMAETLAAEQETRTKVDNVVTLNGRRVTPDELPPDLRKQFLEKVAAARVQRVSRLTQHRTSQLQKIQSELKRDDFTARKDAWLVDNLRQRGAATVDYAVKLLVRHAGIHATDQAGIADYEQQVRAQLDSQRQDVQQLSRTDFEFNRQFFAKQYNLSKQIATTHASLLAPLAAQHRVPDRYAAAAVRNQTHSWIRTPTIVISWNDGLLANAVGGHNLNSRTSEFKVDARVPPGQPRVVGRTNVIEINPAEADRIGQLVRTAGRNASDAATLQREIRQAVSRSEPADVRPRHVALKLGQNREGGRAPPSRGLVHRDTTGASFGWQRVEARNGARLATLNELKKIQSNAVFIERQSDSSFLIAAESNGQRVEVTARTVADTVDTVALLTSQSTVAEPLLLTLKGFQRATAEVMSKNLEVRLKTTAGDQPVWGFVAGKTVRMDQLSKTMTAAYDFPKAQVTMATNKSGDSVAQIRIPPIDPQTSTPTISLNWGKQPAAKTQSFRTRVRDRFNRIFGRKPKGLPEAIKAMKREIREIERETNVKTYEWRLWNLLHDWFIVDCRANAGVLVAAADGPGGRASARQIERNAA